MDERAWNAAARCRAGVGMLLLALLLPGAGAELRLPGLFSDHMVLQRGRPLHVWGWADPGERVEVRIAGRRATTEAGPDGKWRARLALLRAGGPYELEVRDSRSRIAISDVMVGEVWIGSGQSNMQWPLRASQDAEREIAAARRPELRLFSVPRETADQPAEDVAARWEHCTPETAAEFSAVAYYFGRELARELGVTVGLIHTSWGGTPAESWIRRETLAARPEYHPLLAHWDQARRKHDEDRATYERQMEAWRASGSPADGRPTAPRFPSSWLPGVLHNGMIAPLAPYAFRGAIWYQGESNAERAYQYRDLFPTLIRDWRASWNAGDFPFLFVQLANFRARQEQPGESNWAELREAQRMALALPKTAMASAVDIGDASDIHPRNKAEVGRRLALGALALAHGRRIAHSGPLYRGMKSDGGSLLLRFDHTHGGLVLREGGPAFAVAGADRRFVWAQARVEGRRLRIWSREVPHPVAARYAWSDNPESLLYNGAGLPASPFRTDDWPGLTVGKQTPGR